MKQTLFGNIFGSGGSRSSKRTRIGLAGSGPMMDAMARAVASIPRAEPVAMYCPPPSGGTDPGFDEFLSAADAVEIFGPPGEHRDNLAISLMRAGKHISLNKPFAASVDQAQSLIDEANRADVFLRVNEPALFHTAFVKLKELMDGLEIGEICGVRIRANLCGRGGWGPQPELLKGNFLLHPAFDCFALAQWLAGPVDSVRSYFAPMSPSKGGSAIIGLKYKAEGCYGHLDLSFSPGCSIRSDAIPCDDSIEIAGTDGIIWARHFHGRMTEEPNIEVRRGKKHYTIGIASGLDFEWRDALRASAAHFARSIRDNKQPSLSPEDALDALKTLIAARESNDTNTEIKL